MTKLSTVFPSWASPPFTEGQINYIINVLGLALASPFLMHKKVLKCWKMQI